jgi:hypothetical protein
VSIKPLIFGDGAKSDKPKIVQPKALDFADTPSTQLPSAKASAPLFLETGGQWIDGRLVDPVQYASTKATSHPKGVEILAFANPASPAIQQAIENFKHQYGDMYRAEGPRIDAQLRQLLPLTLDVVMNWGTKTLERMRDGSKEGMALIAQFTQSNGTEMMQKVTAAMQPATGLLARFKQQNLLVYEAPLAALCASLSLWIPSCTKTIGIAKKNHGDMLLKMATLSVVTDTVGAPTDNMLEQALHNRRITLQSGVMQADLLIKQLEDIHNQMVDQKMRIDQVINVTLSAYQAAKARSRP